MGLLKRLVGIVHCLVYWFQSFLREKLTLPFWYRLRYLVIPACSQRFCRLFLILNFTAKVDLKLSNFQLTIPICRNFRFKARLETLQHRLFKMFGAVVHKLFVSIVKSKPCNFNVLPSLCFFQFIPACSPGFFIFSHFHIHLAIFWETVLKLQIIDAIIRRQTH